MNGDRVVEFLVAASIVLILVGMAIQPYYEARTFNRCTGSSATYFDAVFSELRVIECAEPKP